jgi:hypothetical protein
MKFTSYVSGSLGMYSFDVESERFRLIPLPDVVLPEFNLA